LHGNKSPYASYTDDELRRIIALIPADAADTYVMFNNIPRVKDVKRFRQLLGEHGSTPVRSGGKPKQR
jgi:uncharacterized protein YecE (DUF72 family)